MVLNLNGNRGILFQNIATRFTEAHIPSNVKFEVVSTDKLDAKFKEAVKKAYSAKFLDDADSIARFIYKVEAPEETPPEETSPEDEKTQAPEDGSEQAPEEGDGKEQVAESGDESAENGGDAELKKKIINAVGRVIFEEDPNKIEVSDLDGYMDGYKVMFTKFSFGENTTT